MRRILLALLLWLSFSSVALAVPIYNPQTGHYYERVDQPVTWTEARDLAESMTYLGMSGYLATVTSQEENDWIVWSLCGGINDNNNGRFLGGILVDGNWSWITGETWSYTNWAPGEPSGNESVLQYDSPGTDPVGGGWNDYGLDRIDEGFIVEWGTPLTPIPEPATMLLLASGLVVLMRLRKRFMKP